MVIQDKVLQQNEETFFDCREKLIVSGKFR